jgi:S-(hydroxymethyl)glutathione dehydrogenase/alcohol dehydrogenase
MLKILDLYAQKRLKLDELVSSTISLDRINEGMDLLRSGTVARTLVLMRQEDEEDEA